MRSGIVLERYPGWKPAASAAARRGRIYIFPTRQGQLFGVLLLVMLLGAINYTNSMAYLLVFTLAGVFISTMLYTYRNLRGLAIRVSPATPVFAGEEALFPLLIDNRGGDARVSLDVHPRPGRRRRVRHRYLDIRADALQRETVPVPAQRRGYLAAGRLRITSTWPLGLFRAWSYLDAAARTLVYPAPAGRAALPPFSEDDSEYQAGSQRGTDDFSGYHPYRPGDPVRNIDWKVLAREQGLVVKRFSGSGRRRLILRWEHTARLADVESRLAQLCLWVLEADRLDYHYGLVLPGAEVPAGAGPAHRHDCLGALATYGLED
jgi:uncharacterized protein (DUF58 family)